jgi:hypothetical protein
MTTIFRILDAHRPAARRHMLASLTDGRDGFGDALARSLNFDDGEFATTVASNGDFRAGGVLPSEPRMVHGGVEIQRVPDTDDVLATLISETLPLIRGTCFIKHPLALATDPVPAHRSTPTIALAPDVLFLVSSDDASRERILSALRETRTAACRWGWWLR